jgi:murein DD-endopeptidase MepM/ murein hydrolase activator NlpD
LGAPSTPVQSAPLPPVGRVGQRPPAPRQAASGQAGPVQAGLAPAAAADSNPSPWAQPASPGTLPDRVTVLRGETLFDVAERVRTPVRALIEINALQPPYALTPGTALRVPPPLFYTVGEGDTLFGIARRFNIDARSLANLNGMQLETPIRLGQKIALPSLARDQGGNPQARSAAPPGSASTNLASAQPARPPAARPTAPLPSGAGAFGSAPPPPPAPVVPVAPAAPTENQVAAAGRGKFAWPLKGEVLSTYGPKGPGQRNDGLNIAATVGSSVRAAAAGQVVFAGELPGFGNLVLVKHPTGFVTAYAHLSKIGVKMRDAVAQGQELGLSGQTGLVDRPQLHFEIRYAANPRDKAVPVDPAMLLPKAG